MSKLSADCQLCGKSLIEPVKGQSGWTDDDEYGDVHEYCLENVDLVDDDDEPLTHPEESCTTSECEAHGTEPLAHLRTNGD